MSNERRWYDERQISKILHQAAELQGTTVNVPRQPRGLTYKGILALASELSLESGYVWMAIEQLDERDRTFEPFALAGTSGEFKLERRIEGHIGDDVWAEVVQETRRAFGVTGFATDSRSGRDLTVKEGLISIQLTARTEEGHTCLQLQTERKGQLRIIWACSGVLVLLGAALFGEGLRRMGLKPFLMTVFSLGLVALLVVFVRAGIASWARKDRRKLATLMARLEGIASPAGTPAEAVGSKEGASVM